jgi:succinate dehydrogenase / fumarate reductase cytochrome b subunit
MSNLPQGASGDRTGRYVRQPNGHVTPMSPFTSVWRWHITMVASILFRVTIGAATVGALFILGWAVIGSNGSDAYNRLVECSASPLGLLVWFGLTLVLFSFLLNGTRHLINDMGQGLTVKAANTLSYVAVWGPLVLAVLFWVALFATGKVSL